MDFNPTAIIALCLAALAFGVGLILAYRMSKFLREATRAGALDAEAGGDGTSVLKPARGKRRESKCLAIYKGKVRHTDGALVGGYVGELQPTMLAEDALVEDRCDRLAAMLAADKPTGTMIQFRHSSHPDRGEAIAAHRASQPPMSDVYAPSAQLHGLAVNYYDELAARGAFKSTQLSVWVRVPTKQSNDNMSNGLSAFFNQFRFELGIVGWRNFFAAFRSSYETTNDGILRRMREDEEEAHRNADRTFRLIEREASHLNLQKMPEAQLWQALYMGHNESATSAPATPSSPLVDLRGYLCNDTIEGDGWYVLHGRTPVAMISLFTPPEPDAHAGILRNLIGNPTLTCRHTVVSEFIQLDKEKSRKKLGKRMRRIVKASTKPSGQVKLSEESQRAYAELSQVRSELTSPSKALTQMRFYVLVYGSPVSTQEELRSSVRELEENCEKIIQAVRQMPGADAAREEPEALRAIYHKTIVGELDARKTEREIEESAHSLAAMIPTEGPWRGHQRGTTLVQTVTGALIALNLFLSEKFSPLGLVLGNMGSGKSVFMARIANDVLARLAHSRVVAADFGESLGPLVDVVGGRHLRFVMEEGRTINDWDYPGLELGVMPDAEQIALVTGGILKMARVKDDDVIAESIIETCVKEVYEREVAYNPMPDGTKHEPTLSSLLNLMGNYQFKEESVRRRAGELVIILEKYRGHVWLDAPTHPDYQQHTRLDVYELDSLERFPKDVRDVLAYRVACRVLRSIGQKVNGQLTPTLLIFDEMHKVRDKYPDILTALKKGARQGRKENVVTLLATHTYDDLAALHDITANAGIKIIGKQIGNFDSLVRDAQLSDAASGAISAIRNVPGSHAQYVVVFGSGPDQVVEMVQVDLSPVELWTFTTHPLERNARARIALLKQHWSMAQIVAWLSQFYPRALAFAGLAEIDLSLLPTDDAEQAEAGYNNYVERLLEEIERLAGVNAVLSNENTLLREHVGDDLPAGVARIERRAAGELRGEDSTAIN